MRDLFGMRFFSVAVCLLLLTLTAIAPSTVAQETTAGLQGYVKDASGGSVPGAKVEVTSSALIGTKSMETDQSGYYRFANLPPGVYTLTITAQNFRTYKQTDITLTAGRLPTIDVVLEVGAVTQVVEVSGAAPLVDVTQSKVQTIVTADVLANVPKGRFFQSVIQFAPGSRSEPLQGAPGGVAGATQTMGYQIDGASNAENSYLVEGQETASIQTGASNVNVPMEFIQEVQIKSSGFEAEYGGALGGVVTVIQKRGGNTWHGSVVTSYQGDVFDVAPNRVLRKNPQIPANSTLRLDQPAQYFQPIKDHYRYVDPGLEMGGYLAKDRLWVFGSFVPRIVNTRRTVVFGPTAPVPGANSFNQQSITYYSLARVDVLATQKIRLFGSWQTNYQRVTGAVLPTPSDVFGASNPDSGRNVQDFTNSIGYVLPRVIYNVGADMTISPTLVATTRFGYVYQDYQDRGLPVGIRYFYRDTNYPYSTGGAPAPATLTALNGTTLGTAAPTLVQSTGWSSIGANYATVFDKYSRLSFSQDLAYFKRAFGTHNFKVGYAFNRLQNDVQNGYNTADVYVAFGVPYGPSSTNGIDRCLAIINQNIANGWASGGPPDGSECRGLWGTVNVRDLATTGKVGSWNHSLYVQDAWTVGKGVTLNLGVRFDKESLPSYQTGFLGINFGFNQKVAPRLGGAWDVLGNGKLKLYGSYGWFYDIMKFEMPRGSFGGDYWHDCVYALDTTNFSGILPVRDAANHYCPLSGGANGTLPAGLRFIENYDYRQPSNDPSFPGSLGPTGLVDPNLRPMKQHEYVLGANWAITPTMAFETRYARKRLDRTIEDSGIITQSGEQYYIVNPGISVSSQYLPSYECVGCPPNPKANRSYDGVEFRLTKRGGGKWFTSLSYTYSRLYGNYTGLTATDISDGGAGRNSPNVDRAFDEPFMQYDAHGKLIEGPLATDRPHTFKAFAYYTLKWWKMETLIGAYQQVFSGTPLSTYISVWGAPVFVEGRGRFAEVTRDPTTGAWSLGKVSDQRTPMFSQTDLSLVHEMHVSETNEAMKVGFEVNMFNIFNQHSPTFINQNLIRTAGLNPDRCSVTGTCPPGNISGIDYKVLLGPGGYDYVAQANSQSRILNSLYGMPFGWQDPRSFRFKFKFIF